MFLFLSHHVNVLSIFSQVLKPHDIFAVNKLAFKELENVLFVVARTQNVANSVCVDWHTRLHQFNMVLATCLSTPGTKKFFCHLFYFLEINFLGDSVCFYI